MPTAKEYEIGAMEAHDTAGYETDIMQPADWGRLYGDGYGNNVAHGDRSMQRMVERGARTPWNTTEGGEEEYGQAQPPKGYDTDPFMSKAQRAYMHIHHPKIAARWEKHTPKGVKLPEHKR